MLAAAGTFLTTERLSALPRNCGVENIDWAEVIAHKGLSP